MNRVTFDYANEIILNRELFRGRSSVIKDYLFTNDIKTFVQEENNKLLISLEKEILSHQLAEDSHTYIEEKYESWKDECLDSFPENSFRRRFLQFYWEIEKPRKKRIIHTVSISAKNLFPLASVRYPPELGNPVIYTEMNESIDEYTV